MTAASGGGGSDAAKDSGNEGHDPDDDAYGSQTRRKDRGTDDAGKQDPASSGTESIGGESGDDARSPGGIEGTG